MRWTLGSLCGFQVLFWLRVFSALKQSPRPPQRHGPKGQSADANRYVVFQHKSSSIDTAIFQFILGTWLSNSDYLLDNRPHFELLGDKYKNADPNSEEDIWRPIKPKNIVNLL